MSITVTTPMLHQCNIFSEFFSGNTTVSHSLSRAGPTPLPVQELLDKNRKLNGFGNRKKKDCILGNFVV